MYQTYMGQAVFFLSQLKSPSVSYIDFIKGNMPPEDTRTAEEVIAYMKASLSEAFGKGK